MAGITPTEGQDYIAEVLYSQGTSPQDLTLGLFVNTTGALVEGSDWSSITQPVGGGYAEIALIAGTWSIGTSGVATYTQQSWTATGDWDADVYGYYIRTQEGSPRLLHFEYNSSGSRTMETGNIYTVDLSSNTEST